MATPKRTNRATISGDQRVKLGIWLHSHKEEVKELTADAIADRYFAETGVRLAPYNVQVVADQSDVEIAARARKQRVPKVLNQRVRTLATHVKHLYESLSVPVPWTLHQLATGRKLDDELKQSSDDPVLFDAQ